MISRQKPVWPLPVSAVSRAKSGDLADVSGPTRRRDHGVHRKGLLRAFVYQATWDISKRVQATCIASSMKSGACTLEKSDTRVRAPSSKPP